MVAVLGLGRRGFRCCVLAMVSLRSAPNVFMPGRSSTPCQAAHVPAYIEVDRSFVCRVAAFCARECQRMHACAVVQQWWLCAVQSRHVREGLTKMR